MESLHENHEVTNILDLPDTLLGNISVRVAKNSVRDTLNLHRISKAFNTLTETKEVLAVCPLEELPQFPKFKSTEFEVHYRLFLKKLRRGDNGKALYRKGVYHYFDQRIRENKQLKRLSELTRSANQGSKKAQYTVGIILICLGGQRKQEGYQFLRRLMRPRLSQTITEVSVMRMWLKRHVIWRSEIIVKELLSRYVHSLCECGDAESVTAALWFLRVVYDMEGDWDMHEGINVVAPICLLCFWHREVIHLLAQNPEDCDVKV